MTFEKLHHSTGKRVLDSSEAFDRSLGKAEVKRVTVVKAYTFIILA